MGRLLILYFLKPHPTTAATTAVTTANLFFLLLLLNALLSFLTTPAHALQDADTANPTFLHIASSDNSSPSQPRPPPPPLPPNAGPTTTSQPSSFRPSIAIIVGVLTTLFSITFLILLYAKHCKRGALVIVGANSNSRPSGPAQRKNSGIDRSVIESLPVFRFSSLRGQKDGLECAVCLTRFEPTEVLRLLPKCKHAFHVECVDTWLDAHSTCPLCRYRVDPEDVLLIDDAAAKLLHSHNSDFVVNIENDPSGFRRVSGRHSFAGEHRPGHQNIILASFRRSLDSWTSFKKKSEQPPTTTTNVGCFDRPRKDGLLLGHDRTRLEHRIIVSPWSGSCPSGVHQRWSDVHPSDLLYLRSEMIMSEGLTRQQIQLNDNNNVQPVIHAEAAGVVGPGGGVVGMDGNRRSRSCGNDDGRSVINTRSVSEITGLSRFSNRGTMMRSNEQQQQQRHLKLVARWVAWVSSLSRPALRTERTTTPTTPPPIC